MCRVVLAIMCIQFMVWPLMADDSGAVDEMSRRLAMPAAKAIETELVITLEYISNVKGGIERGELLLGNVDLTAEIDTEGIGLWKGGTLFLYGLGNFNSGKLPTEIIGDIQATSNIEAPDTAKLYEAWYNHEFLDGALAILLGLYDYNSEFSVMEYAGVFPNSSFGIGPQISQVGPSIFPTTSLALRLNAKPSPSSYMLVTLYDGVPGDPAHERSNPVILKESDGLFYGVEAGLTPDEDADSPYYKLAIGGWYHTCDIEDCYGNETDKNGGIYILGELSVFREDDKNQGLGIFAQYGNAMEDRSEIAYSVIGGLNYTGLIPGRDEDIFGLGVAHAVLSDDFRATEDGAGLDQAETAIEAVYAAYLTDRVTVLLDAQYVINPSSEPDIEDALQLGGRLSFVF
ncbi:hypothetical protein BVX97_02980 [bacterium E08(2017)]|nr:hypothetical protein BVX97_02980 [bacterium E08(2017)]